MDITTKKKRQPTRKTAEVVDAKNIVSMLDRITVLLLVREAADLGINVKIIPLSTKKCTRIVKEILQKLRPNIQCVPRYYCIQKTGINRTCIGSYHITTCPWGIEFIPQTNTDSRMPVITDASKVIPYNTSYNYNSRKIEGTIGAYAKANGFQLLYAVQKSGNIIIWADPITPKSSYNSRSSNTEDMMCVIRNSVISPIAFFRCISYVSDELQNAGILLDYCNNIKEQDNQFMEKLHNQQEQTKITKVKKVKKTIDVEKSKEHTLSIHEQIQARISKTAEELINAEK